MARCTRTTTRSRPGIRSPAALSRSAFPGTSAPWTPPLKKAGGNTTTPDATYNSLLGFKHGPDTGAKLSVELEPELAQSWEWSPDGTQVTMNLASGVKFHNVEPLNGRDFSSADVLSWAQRQSTVEGGVNKGAFGLVTDMTTPDANTFQFTLSAPSPDFLIPFGTHFMSVYPHELVEQDLIDTNAIGPAR